MPEFSLNFNDRYLFILERSKNKFKQKKGFNMCAKFSRPNSYNGKQSNKNWTGQVRAANSVEAAAGTSEQLYISPATLADAVVALVPDATPTVPGIVTVTAAPFDTGAVATKAYADNLAIAGAPISEEAVNGIGQIATDAEAVAGTANNPGVTALFVTPSNLSPVFAAPPAIGGTTPAGGAFTTLSASGAFSLTGDQVQVAEGGTGASSLTDHGIMLGSGTSTVSVTAVGTTGQILIGQSGADPIWTTNVDLPGTLDVTGAATFDSTVDIAGAVTLTGTFDIDNLNFSGNTISSTDTNGDINLTPDGTGNVVLGAALLPASGGTGLTSITDHSVMVGSGTGAVTPITVGTNGQVLLGSTGADPVFATLTSSGTIGFTTGAGTLALDAVLTSPGAIGSVAPNTGAFTTLSASSTFSLTGDTVDVAEGGTGASSLTDHGVLVGSGTASVTPLAVGTNGQLLVGSTGADPAFATAGSSLSSIVNTLGAGTFSQDIAENWLRVATVTIATGDVLTLATTPYELVAAPGAGKYIEFLSAQFILDYNSIPYTESGDNLGIKYTNASGVQVSSTVECTGFIDQSADTITSSIAVADAIVAATGAVNQALVLDNLGSNFAAGNSPLIVKVSYRVITTGL